MKVLGVDPGSRAMGYGVLRQSGGRFEHLDHGVVRPPGDDLTDRLKVLYDALCELLTAHRPEAVAIEDVFQLRNARAAFVLAHARAAAVLAAANHGIRVFSYAPAQVKKAVTGTGRADKHQVAEMIKLLLSLDKAPPLDAADALAVAVCHSMRAPALARGAAR